MLLTILLDSMPEVDFILEELPNVPSRVPKVSKKVEEPKVKKTTIKEAKEIRKALTFPITGEMREIAMQAKDFPAHAYTLIRPVRGTIAFMALSTNRSNDDLISYLQEHIDEGDAGSDANKLRRLIIRYNNLDELSQRRHDIIDHLCREKNVDINSYTLWGYIAAGATRASDRELILLLNLGKEDVIRKTIEMASTDAGIRDRQLLADMTGLTKKAPLIGVNMFGGGNGAQMDVTIPKFEDNAVAIEKVLGKPLELMEGDTDYVDADFEMQNDREPVRVSENTQG